MSAPPATSQITGEMRTPSDGILYGGQSVLLRDYARHVPVTPAWDASLVPVSYWRFVNGKWWPWVTTVCCGPAAPFPAVPGDPITREDWWYSR